MTNSIHHSRKPTLPCPEREGVGGRVIKYLHLTTKNPLLLTGDSQGLANNKMKNLGVKIIKTIVFSFLLSILLLLIFMATKNVFYWKVINAIISYRGNSYLNGESRGQEVVTVLFKIVYPVLYLLSVLIVYRFYFWKNRD